VEKLQQQLKWNGGFPGVHSLLLKGCTHPSTYEPTVELLSRFTLLLELPVVDPSQSLAFPLNVMALLPYLLHHYEDANQLCVQSAENIAQVRTNPNNLFDLALEIETKSLALFSLQFT